MLVTRHEYTTQSLYPDTGSTSPGSVFTNISSLRINNILRNRAFSLVVDDVIVVIPATTQLRGDALTTRPLQSFYCERNQNPKRIVLKVFLLVTLVAIRTHKHTYIPLQVSPMCEEDISLSASIISPTCLYSILQT